MSSDEVIELSIEETQALRAKLGLAPLRVGNSTLNVATNGGDYNDNNNTTSNNNEELSLSIEETNALRLKIGLPPLNNTNNATSSSSTRKEGSSSSTAIHAPPTNTAAENEAKRRLDDAKAKREARERLLRLEEENQRDEDKKGESALNFAARMMMMQDGDNGCSTETNTNDDAEILKRRKKKKKKNLTSQQQQQLSIPTEQEEQQQAQYTSADLQGIKISHAKSDFTSGSTTILTLADNSILEIDPTTRKATGITNASDNNDTAELINVNMDADSKALENLKRKRQIELGMGRAGGYAGYDDDEFEELGGVASAASSSLTSGGAKNTSSRGFAIGAHGISSTNEETKNKSDLFSSLSGKAVSLESRFGGNTIASDFMTHEDDNEGQHESKEEKLEKERAKQMKLLEKMREKNKKMMKKDRKQKKKKRRVQSEDDESEDENGGLKANIGGSSLMASLEATAVDFKNDGNSRKRRRNEDGSVDNEQTTGGDMDEIAAKKDRFEQIMQKGKSRTDKAFQNSAPFAAASEMADEDNAEDDAFLNVALAKARRLKQLRDMNNGTSSKAIKGEEAVVNAVEQIKQEEASGSATNENGSDATKPSGGLTFEFDEMQEFTRALRAREDQAKRTAPVRSRGVQLSTVKKEVVVKKEEVDDGTDQPLVEDVDMEEMAQEMAEDDKNNYDDDNNQAFGSTAENSGVGRGMSGFLSLLKQTGEIKNAGKEEMRGRAKDKRTYEDYDNLDLKKVVKIDSRNAQEKDIEFANREIKLEYRDDHGRLLTRKEAYRNMCYQFHGHGSSKKNEERRQKQIEREREENKLASRQVMAEGGVGTLGALKATQKATGKAFIVHKT